MSADASPEVETPPARRPRSDSARNRERLLVAAREAFTADGAETSLEGIARRAGVGVGTLYRHFPTRRTLLEAVYRREVDQLADAAPRLLAERGAGEALRQWLRLAIDYLATKRVIGPALAAGPGGTGELYALSGGRMIEAVNLLLGAARASGDIRPDTQPDDLLRMMVAMSYGLDSPGWDASARRLADVLVDGLQARRSDPAGGAR